MKKRILFSACVLAGCLGACTNDDFTTEKSQGIVESNGTETVIGADLVSEGLKIRFEQGATTRVDNEGRWEIGDQVGMGWYNYGNSTEAILGTQDKATWWANAASGADTKLYANHIFSGVGTEEGMGVWETTTNVYQGAYFMYFPYEPLDEITQKKLKLNSVPQKEDFQQDWLNNGLMLSAQDFIMKGEDVDPATHTLTKSFIMAPMVNALKMEMAPQAEIKNAAEGDGAYLKGMNITSVELTAGGTGDPFAKAGQDLVIKGIPKIVTQYPGGMNDPLDEEGTYEALYNAAAGAMDGSSFLGNDPQKEGTLTTEVQNPNFTLADSRMVRAFALPIPDAGVTYSMGENPSAVVSVGRLNDDGTTKYVLGTFDVTSANNAAFINKLKTALEGTNATLNKVLVHADGSWGYLDLTSEAQAQATLLLNAFTPETGKIETIEQWNDLVSVYDALNTLMGEANVADPTFVWDPKDNTQVFANEIKTPKEGTVTLETASGDAMTITGDVVWPENLLTNKAHNASIVVSDGATLTVGETDESVDVDDKEVIIEANIENNGIIYAGKNASIGTEGTNGLEGLDNTLNVDGKNRVIVTYGAYVYPSDDAKKGVIAYEVQAYDTNEEYQEEVSRIQVLVGDVNKNVEWANINTLIVPEGVELDLNAPGKTIVDDDDRYEGADETVTYEMPDLSDVDIELTGGTVVKALAGNLTHVKNVYAVSGESEIWDIEPLKNIVVKGGTLGINTNATIYPYGKDLRLTYGATVEVKGEGCTLNVNTNLYTTYLINGPKGTININDANAIWIPSVDQFTNGTGSHLTGRLEYTNSTAAQSVKDSFNLLLNNASAKNAINGGETVFLSAMNSNVKTTVSGGSYESVSANPDSYCGFYKVFSEWWTSVYPGQTLTAGTDEITSDHLAEFITLTGYTFTWKSNVQ